MYPAVSGRELRHAGGTSPRRRGAAPHRRSCTTPAELHHTGVDQGLAASHSLASTIISIVWLWAMS